MAWCGVMRRSVVRGSVVWCGVVWCGRAALHVRIQAPLGRELAAGPEIARPEAMSRSYRAEWGAAGRDPAPGSGLALGLLECPVKGRANPARAVGAAIDRRLC